MEPKSSVSQTKLHIFMLATMNTYQKQPKPRMFGRDGTNTLSEDKVQLWKFGGSKQLDGSKVLNTHMESKYKDRHSSHNRGCIYHGTLCQAQGKVWCRVGNLTSVQTNNNQVDEGFERAWYSQKGVGQSIQNPCHTEVDEYRVTNNTARKENSAQDYPHPNMTSHNLESHERRNRARRQVGNLYHVSSRNYVRIQTPTVKERESEESEEEEATRAGQQKVASSTVQC